MNEFVRATEAAHARTEGCADAQRGVPFDKNPYTPGSLLHNCWRDGWRVAQAIGWIPQFIQGD